MRGHRIHIKKDLKVVFSLRRALNGGGEANTSPKDGMNYKLKNNNRIKSNEGLKYG